jgi:hypothetical protein
MEYTKTRTDSEMRQTQQRRFSRELRHDADRFATLEERSTVFKGLCSNCEHLEDCGLVSPTADTQFCEEYSYPRPSPVLKVLEKKESTTSEHMGLCVNCEQRNTCTFPKPPGGIWFCGEYE